MRDVVETWLSDHTWSGGQWGAEELCALKGEQHVSVVLPARNEEATVGAIVAALRRHLVERIPLIDELVVIDSGCTDGTGRAAEGAGARVVRQGDVLPQLGNRPGKGEALWKSLFVTDSDLVAFIDADLRDFDTAFAVGLLGPLLTEPSVQFVKAFYDRPLDDGHTLLPSGGGRVTELMARPLLNLHWPLLAGVVQPLAGECAARRSLLEQLPFTSGYGVEIGMLIDVLESVGLPGMGQVDLGRRRHRNSDDSTLGRMAAQVYLTVAARLDRYGLVTEWQPPARSLTQFVRVEQRLVSAHHDVGVEDRPPMISLADYRRRQVGVSA